MTAIAEERDTKRALGTCPVHADVDADAVIYLGTLAGLVAGLAQAGDETAGFLTVGRAQQSRDNTGGDAGDLEIDIDEGIFPWESSGIDAGDIGKVCFVVDNQTVSLDDSDGARPFAGIIRKFNAAEGGVFVESSLALSTMYAQGGNAALASVEPGQGASLVGIEDSGTLFTATNVEDALAEVKTLADAAIALGKRTVQITHADLTDAVNGEAQVINIGDALPTNAVVLGHEVLVSTLFSGGSVSAVALDIGGTDADAIVDGMDVFTGAATGSLSPRTGAHAQGKFSAQQLTATFTPDGAHTLAELTAGDLTITVWYTILP